MCGPLQVDFKSSCGLGITILILRVKCISNDVLQNEARNSLAIPIEPILNSQENICFISSLSILKSPKPLNLIILYFP